MGVESKFCDLILKDKNMKILKEGSAATNKTHLVWNCKLNLECLFLRMAKEWYLISRKMNLRKGVRSWSDDANIKFADLLLSSLPSSN